MAKRRNVSKKMLVAMAAAAFMLVAPQAMANSEFHWDGPKPKREFHSREPRNINKNKNENDSVQAQEQEQSQSQSVSVENTVNVKQEAPKVKVKIVNKKEKVKETVKVIEKIKFVTQKLPATGPGAIGVLGLAAMSGLTTFGIRKFYRKQNGK